MVTVVWVVSRAVGVSRVMSSVVLSSPDCTTKSEQANIHFFIFGRTILRDEQLYQF
jgi:hypothetical protein